MSQLSSYLGSGMPSATSMIDRLVKKGLVERVEDASDRRVVSCRLTSAGHEVVEQFLRMGRTRNEALAGLLTLEELRTVVPALEILSNAAARRSRAGQPEHPRHAAGAQETVHTSSGAT